MATKGVSGQPVPHTGSSIISGVLNKKTSSTHRKISRILSWRLFLWSKLLFHAPEHFVVRCSLSLWAWTKVRTSNVGRRHCECPVKTLSAFEIGTDSVCRIKSVSQSVDSVGRSVVWHFHSNDLIIESKGGGNASTHNFLLYKLFIPK